MAKDQPALPTDYAFVVQFYRDTEMGKGPVTGRAGHIVSGRAKHFRSWDELATFLTGVLAAVKAERQEDEG